MVRPLCKWSLFPPEWAINSKGEMITNTDPTGSFFSSFWTYMSVKGTFLGRGPYLPLVYQSSTSEMFHISIPIPTSDWLKIKDRYCRTWVENIELLKQQVGMKILFLFMITLLSSSKKEIVFYLLENSDKSLMDLIQSVNK